MNRRGQIAGSVWGCDQLDGAVLRQDGQIIELHDFLPPESGLSLGQAMAINDAGQIVGRAWGFGGNPNIEAAFIWQNDTMTDLNDLITDSGDVHLTQAHAINNQGQITGKADLGVSEIVAVLLTPIHPPGDLDGDCSVGIADFLALLLAWGPCPGACPPSCAADLDGDCDVGIVDFLALLANWG